MIHHLRRNIHHIKHYVPLIMLFIACIWGFYMFSYDKIYQTAIVTACSGGYVAWGIVHHVIHKDFSLTVLSEYITIALLGLAILLSIIFWS